MKAKWFNMAMQLEGKILTEIEDFLESQSSLFIFKSNLTFYVLTRELVPTKVKDLDKRALLSLYGLILFTSNASSIVKQSRSCTLGELLLEIRGRCESNIDIVYFMKHYVGYEKEKALSTFMFKKKQLDIKRFELYKKLIVEEMLK